MSFVVVVNFKTYPQATGERALALAKECEQAAKEYGVDIRIAVQATDLWRIAQAVRIPVYAQHADPISADKHTGFVSAHAIKQAGAKGALLNHAEHRMTPTDIITAYKQLRKEGLDQVILCESVELMRELAAHINPTFFSIEPPELIAGDVSVSMARPDLVKQAVHAVTTPVLIGAGVKRYEDIVIAKELHAAGILLASGIVLAPHRGKAFRQLLTPHAR